MKSSFFAKGRHYFRNKKSPGANTSSVAIQTSNPGTHRIQAPIDQSSSNSNDGLRQLIYGTQQSLLKNYQMTIDQQNATIHKQRQVIARLSAKSSDLVDLLTRQQDRLKEIEAEKQKVEVLQIA